jgi:hypothetical protein
MKPGYRVLLSVAFLLSASLLSADVHNLVGTWSGSWTPKGGVMDAVSVQFQEESGILKGKFMSPAPVEFTKVSVDKTDVVRIEATDPKTGKVYKVEGKLKGTEIKGTFTAGDVSGDLLLIKWTYVPH